jgi:hypothetical protein
MQNEEVNVTAGSTERSFKRYQRHAKHAGGKLRLPPSGHAI